MESSDSAVPEQLLYEYSPKKGFSYTQFISLVVPVVPEYFQDTGTVDLRREDGTQMEVDISDTDYSRQIEEMFDRIGLREMQGATDTVFIREMSYIDAVVQYQTVDHKGRTQPHIGKFPLNIRGRLVVYPKGVKILT